MTKEPEYAEIVTLKQRLIMMLKIVVFGGLFVIIYKIWILPNQRYWTGNMQCHELFGINGVEFTYHITGIVMLSIIVGMMVFTILTIWKIYKYKQFPFPGAKVLNKTKIQRGFGLKIRKVIGLMLLPILLAILINFIIIWYIKLPKEFNYFEFKDPKILLECKNQKVKIKND